MRQELILIENILLIENICIETGPVACYQAIYYMEDIIDSVKCNCYHIIRLPICLTQQVLPLYVVCSELHKY